MRWTKQELEKKVAALTEDIKTDIICGVAWNFFGDLDENEDEFIYTARRADSEDLRRAEGFLREELEAVRPELTVKRVIRPGELEIEPGHTVEEILEEACACMDRANTSEICGEVVFEAHDGKTYVGVVEFVISPANPEYIKDVLAEDAGEDEED